MKDYAPLPNDEFRLNGKVFKVDRVFPEQVVVIDVHGEQGTMAKIDFMSSAKKSFAGGAELWRDGVCVYPEPAAPDPEPVEAKSGSHNTHARLSPSDSKRWTNCTASIAFQEVNGHRVKDAGDIYADEGTQAHDWASNVLLGKTAPIEVPESFRDPVLAYTHHCNSLVPHGELTNLQECLDNVEMGFDAPEHAVFVEEQIPLFYQPEQTGTADFIAVTEGRVYVRDYKHGAGVLVSSQENTQLAIYAYSIIKHLAPAYSFTDDTVVDIAIVQPRHREADGVPVWEITVADLRTFCEEIEYRATQAKVAADRVREKIGSTGRDVSCEEILEAAPGAKFSPSEGDEGACRWCRCKAICSKRLAALTEGMELPSMPAEDMIASMPELAKPEQKLPVEQRIAIVSESLGSQGRIITDEYLVTVAARAKALRSFLSDVEEYLETRLLAGEQIDGVKLVDGREGNREWSNEEEAETFLKGQGLKQDELFDYKLKSHAKIEALLKEKIKGNTRTKNRFEQLIVRSPAKKKLAIDADSRPVVQPAVAMMPDEDFEV
jgi:hypothetical protein